jgi:protein-S-isoprenylcysteine O-methyltransferase Ste14
VKNKSTFELLPSPSAPWSREQKKRKISTQESDAMALDSNPFESPLEASSHVVVEAGSNRWSTRRKIAVLLLVLPFMLALPIRYWVFHHAGSWFVSTDLAPNQRVAFLGLMYLPLMLSISILSFSLAALLLWMDRWRPLLSGWTAILFSVLSIPAIFFLSICVQSYLRWG